MKRLAWFAPLSGDAKAAESIGAYWSDLLLPELRSKFEIELFHNSFSANKDLPAYHFLAAANRHAEKPFDIFLYHFEDRAAADFVRMHLGLVPGVVVFHDLLLTRDGPEPIINSSWEETIRYFRGGRTDWPVRDDEHKRERPIAVREIALAALPIFSCARMHEEFKRAIANRPNLGIGKSYYLPHPVAAARKRHASAGGKKVALCGSPQIEYRAHKIFQALSSVNGVEAVWLVGSHEEVAAREILREFSGVNCRLEIDRAPARWAEIVSEADVALHTLFSVYGQMGPYIDISQMAGVPAVVLAFGGGDLISAAAAFKIEPGEREALEITAALKEIFSNRTADWGAQGAISASEEHSVEKVAAELTWVLNQEAPALKATLEKWENIEKQARDVALSDAIRGTDPIISSYAAAEQKIFSELGWL